MHCLSFAPLYVDLRSGLQGWPATPFPDPGLGLETFSHRVGQQLIFRTQASVWRPLAGGPWGPSAIVASMNSEAPIY
jgi:hypothetical protein